MADISKITLPDNSTYDLKDSVARNTGTYYAICNSASSAVTKEVTISNLSAIVEGTRVNILFRNAQTTTNPIGLKINDTSKPIAYNGTNTFATSVRGRVWEANEVVSFVFCSDSDNHPTYYWVMEKLTFADSSSGIPGITRISNSTTSTSEAIAPTLKAVRSVESQIAQIEETSSSASVEGSYNIGDYFTCFGKLYRCISPIAVGDAIDEGTNCEVVNIGSELQTKTPYSLLAPLETSTTASRAYVYGERFVYNGVLYQAISPIASGGTITPGTNCQDATSIESRFKTYSYTANGSYTVTLARNSRRYLVIADRLGRAAVLMAYIAYNGNTPQLITLVDIDSTNRGISLSISGATLTITVSQTYAIVKIMEV